MKKATLLAAFIELPKEFELAILITCIHEVQKLEQEIEASRRIEAINSGEIEGIIKKYFTKTDQ